MNQKTVSPVENGYLITVVRCHNQASEAISVCVTALGHYQPSFCSRLNLLAVSNVVTYLFLLTIRGHLQIVCFWETAIRCPDIVACSFGIKSCCLLILEVRDDVITYYLQNWFKTNKTRFLSHICFTYFKVLGPQKDLKHPQSEKLGKITLDQFRAIAPKNCHI